MKYSNILKIINEFYDKEKFNLALHTTKNEYVNSILETGIQERGFRKIEGTIKFVGDVKDNVNEATLNFFFCDTDRTMLIALPKFLDTIPTKESFGGNYSTCDFSRFLELIVKNKIRKQNVDNYILEKFTYKAYKVIPSEMIMGYYDDNENLILNKKCYLFNKDKTFVEKLENEYKKLNFKIQEKTYDLENFM